MKKVYQALIFSLLFMLSIGLNAEAGYVAGENAYTDSESNGAHMVIIYIGTNSSSLTPADIYYANQSNEAGGFSDLKMLMKLDAPAGTYTVITDTDNNGKTFEISDAQAYVSGGKALEFLDVEKKSESSYSVAFGLSPSVLFSGVSELAMVMGNMAYSTDLVGENSIINWTSGTIHLQDGYFMFAIQIDNVDAEYITDDGGTYTPKFSLFVK